MKPGMDPIDLGWLPDDEQVIEAALEDGADRCDALLTSGGVSMGDFDFVKSLLQRLGHMNWMQIAIRPAKPFAFGTVLGTPIFGLPGNPVSSAVSFELLARPALLKMMGRPDTQRRQIVALADEPLVRRPDGKTHFVRVQVERRRSTAHPESDPPAGRDPISSQRWRWRTAWRSSPTVTASRPGTVCRSSMLGEAYSTGRR